MTLTILDPCTGNRVTIRVPSKPQTRRVRRIVLRELDRVVVPEWERAAPSWVD